MDIRKTDPTDIEVGVVGIGLMGTSIIVQLLASGHRVKAIAPIPSDLVGANERIAEQLEACSKAGILDIKTISFYLNRLDISMDYSHLSGSCLVLECVAEDIKIKTLVYQRITDVVAASTIIASNTSAIAITILQKLVSSPERFIGIHWSEPAYVTRFMEITCSDVTDVRHADWVFKLAHKWGKEPTLLRKDIKGFITNRLMYAVYREIFHLTENGKTTMEDADKAFRYDVGSWITLMGLFRRIDYSGIADYAEIFKTLFPKLSNTDNVPDIMQKMVDNNGRGIHNLKGLYHYTSEEAKEWEEAFLAFNNDIFRLAALYPSSLLENNES